MSGPRSEATKAIFAFIRANEPVLHSDLANHFRPQAAAVGTAISRWLATRMDNMTHAGYIEHTSAGWVICREPKAQGPRLPHAGARRRSLKQYDEPADQASVAQPRRIDMFGPAYVPPVVTHRAGADDHARHPSVINGARRPYWHQAGDES